MVPRSGYDLVTGFLEKIELRIILLLVVIPIKDNDVAGQLFADFREFCFFSQGTVKHIVSHDQTDIVAPGIVMVPENIVQDDPVRTFGLACRSPGTAPGKAYFVMSDIQESWLKDVDHFVQKSFHQRIEAGVAHIIVIRHVRVISQVEIFSVDEQPLTMTVSLEQRCHFNIVFSGNRQQFHQVFFGHCIPMMKIGGCIPFDIFAFEKNMIHFQRRQNMADQLAVMLKCVPVGHEMNSAQRDIGEIANPAPFEDIVGKSAGQRLQRIKCRAFI